MLHNQLIKLTQYNTWANNRIMDYVIEAGEEKSDIILSSSFNTIRKTAYHIYDAETIWLIRLNYQTLEYLPPSRDFKFSLEEFKNIFESCSQAFCKWVEALDEKKILEMCTYKNIKGEEFTSLVADIIQHCMNHSTYHRGQIITMLRSAGFTNVGSTDYISWCRM